ASLTRPGVPEWVVPRERITTLIAEGTRCCGLTLLTGPVGAGKTMALAIWAAARSGRLAWVSLDEYHNRSGVFLSYVVEALRLAGQLAEIRTSDLAFTVDEARLLLAQHGCALSAQSLDCLVRQTQGWAGGLRLAAISMATRPDPDRFVNDLLTEDSDLTNLLE